RSSPRPRRCTYPLSSPGRFPTTTGHRSKRSYTSPGVNGATSSPTTPVSRCASSATTPTSDRRTQSCPPRSSSKKPHAAQSPDTKPPPTDSPPPNGGTRLTKGRTSIDRHDHTHQPPGIVATLVHRPTRRTMPLLQPCRLAGRRAWPEALARRPHEPPRARRRGLGGKPHPRLQALQHIEARHALRGLQGFRKSGLVARAGRGGRGRAGQPRRSMERDRERFAGRTP